MMKNLICACVMVTCLAGCGGMKPEEIQAKIDTALAAQAKTFSDKAASDKAAAETAKTIADLQKELEEAKKVPSAPATPVTPAAKALAEVAESGGVSVHTEISVSKGACADIEADAKLLAAMNSGDKRKADEANVKALTEEVSSLKDEVAKRELALTAADEKIKADESNAVLREEKATLVAERDALSLRLNEKNAILDAKKAEERGVKVTTTWTNLRGDAKTVVEKVK